MKGFVAFVLYVLAFVALIFRGRQRSQAFGFAFLYARNVLLDQILGILFLPLYRIVHPFGIDRLHQPFLMPK